MAAKKKDDRVDKRRVTMTSYFTSVNEEGVPQVERHEAVDYVRPDFLDAYVADARTRWQVVDVSDEPDAGPGGYDGDTNVPVHLVGQRPEDFAQFGDHTTPDNALDRLTGKV